MKDGRNQISLVDYLNNYPLIFKTTDDTVVEGNEICAGNSESVIFVPNEIYRIDWDDFQTNIRCEVGRTTKGKKSIQAALLDIFNERGKYTYLLYDHGSGEIADYITISEDDSSTEITLFHVKAMKGKRYNSDMSDIYEVTQQAIKSTIWLKSKGTLLEKIRSRRRTGNCVMKKGEFNNLEKALKQNNLFTARIVIVQPAISKSTNFPSKYQEVLAATRYYIKNSGRVTALEIWGSN